MSQLDNTIRILKAYLSTNKVPRAELPIFMENVHKAVVELEGLPDDANYESLISGDYLNHDGLDDEDLDLEEEALLESHSLPHSLADRRAQLGLDKAW